MDNLETAKKQVESVVERILPYTRPAARAICMAFDETLALDVLTIQTCIKCDFNELLGSPKVVELFSLAMGFGYALAMADQQG